MNHETAVSNAKDIADRILAPAARTARAREQGRGRRSRHCCYLGGDAGVRRRSLFQTSGYRTTVPRCPCGAVMAPTGDVLRDFIGKAILGIPLF